MDNPIYSSPIQNQNINKGLLFYLSGAENKLVSTVEKRTVAMLAICSVASATVYALAFGWIVESKSSFLVLSIIVGFLVFTCLLLLNRMTFLFHAKNSKGTVLVAIGFIMVYLILSFWIIPEPMTYYFLQTEILKTKTSDSAVAEFAAMLKVIDSLEVNELRALKQYKLLCSGISFVFSLMPLLVNYLIYRNANNEIVLKQEYLRRQIEDLILSKKMQYSALFSIEDKPKNNSDDPFFLEEETITISDEQRFEKANMLLKEINHLRQSLQHLI